MRADPVFQSTGRFAGSSIGTSLSVQRRSGPLRHVCAGPSGTNEGWVPFSREWFLVGRYTFPSLCTLWSTLWLHSLVSIHAEGRGVINPPGETGERFG